METKPRILPSILYCLVGLATLMLSAKDPLVILFVCAIASAFLLAGALLWDKMGYAALLLSAPILYWRSGSVGYMLVSVALLAGLVIAMRICLKNKQPLAVTVGVPALSGAVAAVGVLALYLYATRGAFDFSGLLPSLSQIKATLDEARYEPMLTAAQATQLSSEEIDQAITAVLTAKNMYLDAIYAVLPGFVMSFLFVISYASQMLAKAIIGRKYRDRITIEPIWKLRLPSGVGVVFLASFILSFFVEGTTAGVLDNLMTAFELPLLLCGAFTVYTLFARRATKTGSKVLTGVLVALTAIGIPISLALAYIAVGVIDSIANLRRRLRGDRDEEPENERMEQWNRMQQMKPGNDAEVSEELDAADDEDDEDEGEEQ